MFSFLLSYSAVNFNISKLDLRALLRTLGALGATTRSCLTFNTNHSCLIYSPGFRGGVSSVLGFRQ